MKELLVTPITSFTVARNYLLHLKSVNFHQRLLMLNAIVFVPNFYVIYSVHYSMVDDDVVVNTAAAFAFISFSIIMELFLYKPLRDRITLESDSENDKRKKIFLWIVLVANICATLLALIPFSLYFSGTWPTCHAFSCILFPCFLGVTGAAVLTLVTLTLQKSIIWPRRMYLVTFMCCVPIFLLSQGGFEYQGGTAGGSIHNSQEVACKFHVWKLFTFWLKKAEKVTCNIRRLGG